MDIDPEVFARTLLAIDSADPADLLDELRRELRQLPDALDLTMHLIDYRLVSLRPVRVRSANRLLRPEPVADSALGAAFCTQQPTHEQAPVGHLWHLPVSVRGQQLGVLTAIFARPPSPEVQAALNSLAL